MRADLNREYIHPKTGLVARLNDIAKDFNLSPGVARNRLIKRTPLDSPLRGNSPKVKKARKVVDKMFSIKPKFGLNPFTEQIQSVSALAISMGITYAAAYFRIRNQTTGMRRKPTDEEKMAKFAKRKAAKDEMVKLIIELDKRKAAMNG